MAGTSEEQLHRPTRAELDAAFRFYERVTCDLVAIFDRTGRILFVNPSAERVLGFTPADCIGQQLFGFIHADDRVAARAAFEVWAQAHGENSFQVETRVVARDGTERRLNWTVVPHRDEGGQAQCFISHARDVTPQAESAERLQRSEVRQRSLLYGMLDPVVTIDAHGKVVEASGAMEAVFGWRPEELLGRNIKVLMVEPYAAEHDGYLERYHRTGHTGILGRTRQFEVRRKDGSIFFCELSVSRVDVPGEAEPLFVGSFRDVSARVHAEKALAESEARMRAIFDQELQLVGLLSIDGVLLEVNESALRGIGARREEVIGKPFADSPWWSSPPEGAARVRAAVRAAAGGELVRFEVGYVDREGRLRWIDFSLKPVRDALGAVQFLLPEGRDITRIKEVHSRELAMNDALAQIGESASLLAHEIKNPLTAVNLALRAVADRLGEDQKSVLEDLAGRLAKVERTMRRTLSFTRPLRLERERCEVRSLLEDAVRTLQPELTAARVALQLQIPPNLPPLFADRHLLEEVLLNLMHNAREVLENGGNILVSVERDGRSHLRLRIEDDGPGIAPSVRTSLFKPFVTSKKAGTGLGLAIARKIVLEHGGEIGVEDGTLGGACFWIRLPCADGRYTEVRRRDAASA